MSESPQRIVPHLWYDTQARQAAEFYAGIFPDSKLTSATTIGDTPSGDCEIVAFTLWGQEFMAISAGPLFQFNPSISFMVNFDPLLFGDYASAARAALDAAWEKLSEGGTALMPLDEYPFSKRYGWIQDRFGLSWQLILTDPAGEPRSSIVPSLLFSDDRCGKAEEALRFYLSVFPHSRLGNLIHYGAGQEPNVEGTVMFADFLLEDRWFAAMDTGMKHDFGFNEAISFLVKCNDQAEIDNYWDQLSAVPESEQCGWLKDKFGVSWQIVPMEMDAMMRDGTKEQVERITKAFLPMKKFDLAALRKAFQGK